MYHSFFYNFCYLLYYIKLIITELLVGRSRDRFSVVWPEFLQWHISFRPYHGPWVDSAPNKNEYQEYLLGVKVAGEWG
jgi:hypothetical protein